MAPLCSDSDGNQELRRYSIGINPGMSDRDNVAMVEQPAYCRGTENLSIPEYE